MPARFDSYRVRRGDNLGDPEFWNRRLRDVDARTAALEEQKTTLDAVIEEGRTVFREKANDVLLPLIQEVHEIADVGVMLRARSQTEHQVSVGGKTFVIDEGQRLRFAAPAYVAVYRMESPQAAMLGEVVSYDSGTGELTVDIDRAVGSGAHGGWTITAASPSDTAEAIADVLAAVDLVAADRQTAVEAAALASDKAGLAAQKADESAAFAAATSGDANRAADAITDLEAIYASQSQTYLGAYAADPVADLNGDPLVVGAEYWNTALGHKKIYDGSGWTVAYVPVGSEVTTIFGRTGNVTAQIGDYSAEKVTVVSIPGLAGTNTQAVLESIKAALDTKPAAGHTHAFAELTDKPTTLSGYGISDARTAAQIAADIAAAVADKAPTAYVDQQIGNLLGGAPAAALDTIAELAAALQGNDSDIAAILSQLATKLNASNYTAADVLAKIKTVDGNGSGLDADSIRNLVPSTGSGANTLVQRDASGDISARLLRSEYATTSAAIAYFMTQQAAGTSNNYVRPSTPAQVVSALNSAGGLDAATLNGQAPAAFALSARTISAGIGLAGGGSLSANRTISARVNDQATWSAGTSTTEAVISPAKLKAAVASLAPLDGITSAVASNTGRISALETGKAFTRPPYESSEQIITSRGQLTLSHGLGVLPKLLVAEIVCLTAEHGWAVGQRVPVPLGGEYISGNGANLNATAGATDTAIMVQYGSGGTGGNVFLIHDASGISQYATNANWRLVLRAFA